MSAYTVSILEKPADLAMAVVSNDVLEWYADRVRDHDTPTFDEFLKRITAEHPDDVEIRILRMESGRLSLSIASDTYSETSALDDIGTVIASTAGEVPA